jgi:proliferating cell nuclear antigen
MSFKMVLSDHKTWMKIVEAAASVGDQIAFKVSAKGLRLRMMDPVRVMMLDMELPPEFFEEYACTEDAEVAFTVEDMMKVIRRGQAGDTLTLEDHPKKDNKLLVTFKGATKRTFTLGPLSDLKLEDLPLPKGDPGNVSARLTFEAFGVAVKDAKVPYGSDQATIKADDKDMLVIQADGDTGDAVNEFRRGSEALLDLEVKEKAASTYATSYLESMLKADGLGETAALEFSTNMPLKVTVAAGATGRLTYYLAPRREPA